MQAESAPPQSASKQHKPKIPRRIQSHKRLLDEFSVVVVVTGVVCAACVVGALAVVPGTVVLLPIMAAPMAPAITPPAISPPTTFLLSGTESSLWGMGWSSSGTEWSSLRMESWLWRMAL